MKKYALVLLAFAVSSHIAASEDQLVSKNDKRDKRATVSDSNLIVPVNKSFSKNITVSASILMLDTSHSNKEVRFSNSPSRSPQAQKRLDIYYSHQEQEYHNVESVSSLLFKYPEDQDCIDVIKACPKCKFVYKIIKSNNELIRKLNK